ncbi:MAG: phage late control D family protein [Anaerolineaceae bacterium]|nr:phage late control D family protein [Anaerolineaceae bacterium]
MINNGTQMLTPAFQVKINGASLPYEATTNLYSATVCQDVEAPDMFTLRLLNWDMMKLKFTWVDEDLFTEGNEVEIQMGYVDKLKTMIIGEITGLEPEFCANTPSTLLVRGFDRQHRLLRGRSTRSFIQIKDSDIADQIAKEYGLTANVEDTGVTLEYVLKHNQTDYEFLQERAQRIGYEVTVNGKTLLFRSRQNHSGEFLTLDRSRDLIEFYPRSTTLGQTDNVAIHAWNPRDKAKIVGKAGIGDEVSSMGGSITGMQIAKQVFDEANLVTVNCPVSNQAEADQIAKGQLNGMALSYIHGEGTCVGNTTLKAGIVIKLTDLGERFSGSYYVTSTRHTYSTKFGYRTMFTVRRNST